MQDEPYWVGLPEGGLPQPCRWLRYDGLRALRRALAPFEPLPLAALARDGAAHLAAEGQRVVLCRAVVMAPSRNECAFTC